MQGWDIKLLFFIFIFICLAILSIDQWYVRSNDMFVVRPHDHINLYPVYVFFSVVLFYEIIANEMVVTKMMVHENISFFDYSLVSLDADNDPMI